MKNKKFIIFLQELADGLTYKEIAAKYDSTEASMKNTFARIRGLLDARTSAQAVAIGIRRGIID